VAAQPVAEHPDGVLAVRYDPGTVAISWVELSREEARRKELGDFLRSRRAALKPQDVGIPSGPRRRTPGLRREELAQLASVGVTWYTWLEQGREINVSQSVLLALARALRLGEEEVEHLLRLGGSPPPQRPGRTRAVTPEVQRVLDAWTGPAYVTDARFDVIASNATAQEIFGGFGTAAGSVPNYLRWLYVCDESRRRIINWEDDARRMIGVFRAIAGRYAGDPEFNDLIEDLASRSPEFADWWPRHYVSPRLSGKKVMVLADGRVADYEHTSYAINGLTDCSLVLYTPLDATSDQVAGP
jgi:transcriptional regulator with XRE-family HTH domain